jgi:hypothetical protein
MKEECDCDFKYGIRHLLLWNEGIGKTEPPPFMLPFAIIDVLGM